jgi:hypothetical protein
MTLRTLDLARWRRAEAREMALRPPFRLNVHNRAKCDIGGGLRRFDKANPIGLKAWMGFAVAIRCDPV